MTKALCNKIGAHLSEQGLLRRTDTIVDAIIFAAPTSTKKAEDQRNPEIHQTQKGNQWHVGLNAQIGVDA